MQQLDLYLDYRWAKLKLIKRETEFIFNWGEIPNT